MVVVCFFELIFDDNNPAGVGFHAQDVRSEISNAGLYFLKPNVNTERV